MAYRKQLTRLKAPYLKRILLDPDRVADWEKYPWNLPLFRGREFELEFTTPITIIVGENGTGKSTLLEAIGALAGYDEAGGTIVKPAGRAFWGGWYGYFADADGHVWEVAHNPAFPIAEDGSISLPG